MRSDAERLAGRLGVAGRMAFLGSRAEATELLAASDALLFASRPDGMEGMPGVLIEAAMLGVPAIAYDVAGVREVVSDGASGYVVPWGQETMLADKALSVLTDRRTKELLGSAGRDLARRSFEIGAIARRYGALYREIVGAPRAQESAAA
jgi:glycosyltransferase involved in cell wall biosynthesis